MTRLTLISFSAGRDSAIMTVSATSVETVRHALHHLDGLRKTPDLAPRGERLRGGGGRTFDFHLTSLGTKPPLPAPHAPFRRFALPSRLLRPFRPSSRFNA